MVPISFPFTAKVTSRFQWLLVGELKADATLQEMNQTKRSMLLTLFTEFKWGEA